MSGGSYVGRIGALRALNPKGRTRAALTGFLLIAALLALLVAAWAAALTVGGGEMARADARLAGEVRAAATIFSGRVAAADERAASLARSRPLQRALQRRDAPAIRRLIRGRDVAVYSDGPVTGGSSPGSAVTRSVPVVTGRKPIGRVVGIVRVDRRSLDRLGAAAAVRSPDRLSIASGDRARTVPLGRAFDRVANGRYRVFAARLTGPPRPVVLEASTPRTAISDRTQRRTLWLILATLVSLATLAVAAIGVRSIDRKSTRLNSSHVAISYAVFCLK